MACDLLPILSRFLVQVCPPTAHCQNNGEQRPFDRLLLSASMLRRQYSLICDTLSDLIRLSSARRSISSALKPSIDRDFLMASVSGLFIS